MPAYYNEIDRFKAAWLRELIKTGAIATGEVDERDIKEVEPKDLAGFTQCHFFCGIAVWSYALKNAGWPDDLAVWTGSCPCQGFSASGKRGGFSDQRHLWPAWFRLIRECRPDTIFGEQVASNDGLAWLDVVSSDLEGAGYAVGTADLCAAGFGAPHIRQRLFFVAESEHSQWRQVMLNREDGRDRQDSGRVEAHGIIGACGEVCGLADAEPSDGRTEHREHGDAHGGTRSGWSGTPGELGHAAGSRRQAAGEHDGRPSSLAARSEQPIASGILGESESDGRRERWPESAWQQGRSDAAEPGLTNGFWRDAGWLWCRDGKWRPVEARISQSSPEPLDDGLAAELGLVCLASGETIYSPLIKKGKNRVGRLRGYGDAIVAPVAQAFIEAYLESREVHQSQFN